MPEVITGLSLLLMFISMQDVIGWPTERGAATITITHMIFSMAYVAIIVQSRLVRHEQIRGRSGHGLGRPPSASAVGHHPAIILPAMVTGWLLSFTLSLDDLVIAGFASGPGANTLPMLVFSKVKLGVTPDINAIATIIISVVAVGVLAAALLMMAQERRRTKDMQLAARG